MARKTYVCLDSNILFRFVTQASPKFEEHLWDKLLEAKKQNECVILIPEVIVLEIGKLFGTVEDDIKSACKKVRDRINKAFDETPLIWNELSDAREAISKFFESWETDKLAGIDRRKKKVLDLLQPAHSTIIPYDQQIHFSGHRRFVAGTFPKNPKKDKESRNYEDCCIIESLVSFFKEGVQNKQLLFVTENYLDFGIDVADEQTVLHPLLTSGLPASQVFKNLESLVAFLESKRPIKKISDSDLKHAIRSHLQKENEMRSKLTEAAEASSVQDLQSSSVSDFERAVDALSLAMAEGIAKHLAMRKRRKETEEIGLYQKQLDFNHKE